MNYKSSEILAEMPSQDPTLIRYIIDTPYGYRVYEVREIATCSSFQDASTVLSTRVAECTATAGDQDD